MNITRITKPAFNGKIKVVARDQDSLFESTYKINTDFIGDIKKQKDNTIIYSQKGHCLFISKEHASYKQIMSAYKKVKNTNDTINLCK